MAVVHKGQRIPERLVELAGEIPAEVAKSLSAVDVVARCLAAEDYEAKAADARRRRDWTLAVGYAALGDETLQAPAPNAAEVAEEIRHCRAQIAITSGELEKGYRERLRKAEGVPIEDRHVVEARRLMAAERPVTRKAAGVSMSAITAVREALDEAGLTIHKRDKGRRG